VASFFLTTLRFAAVFLAFLEGFFAFFFAICLLDDTATYIPSKTDAVLLRQASGKDKLVTVEVTFYLRYLSARGEDSSEAATATKSIPAIALLLMPLLIIFFLIFFFSPLHTGRQRLHTLTWSRERRASRLERLTYRSSG